MQNFERDTLSATANGKRVWLLHIVVNALLMIAFFYWTRIPEETGFQFSLTVASGVLIAFIIVWLHAATFDYFGLERSLSLSLRRSISKTPVFLVWCVIFGFGLWLIGQLWTYDLQTGGYVRHILPGPIRRAVTPRTAFSTTFWLIWFSYFFVWPILMLPVGAQVAIQNVSGFFSSTGFRPLRSVRFWIMYGVCFLLGAYIPYELVWMTPRKPSTLSHETWSMTLRFGLAYVLIVSAWIVLCAAIMRASDGDTAVEEPNPGPIAPSPII